MAISDFKLENGLQVTGSQNISGSLNVSNGITGTLAGTASYGQDSNLLDGLDSTAFARLSSNNTFVGNQIVSGNLNLSGTLSASVLAVENPLVAFNTVSTDVLDVTTTSVLSGNTYITGAAYYNGVELNTAGGISAVSSSGNITGSGLSGNELTLKDDITLNSVTASLFGTASYANQSTLAQTASYVTASSIANFTNDVRSQFSAGNNIGINSGTVSLSSSVNLTSITSSNGYAIGSNTPIIDRVTIAGSNAVRFVSGTAGYVGIGTVFGLGTGLLMSGSATGSLVAPNISLSGSNALTAKSQAITVGDNNTITTILNGQTITVGGTSLASLYSANGFALISGSSGINLFASSSISGLAPIQILGSNLTVDSIITANESASFLKNVNVSGTISASAFIGDGSGLTNLPIGGGGGISHIQIPLAYYQETTNLTDTIAGGARINGLYYLTNTAKFEILGYVENSGSDTLSVELYNLTDDVVESTLLLSSSVTTAITSSAINLGSYEKIFEIYIKNLTGTGTVTLLAANMKID